MDGERDPRQIERSNALNTLYPVAPGRQRRLNGEDRVINRDRDRDPESTALCKGEVVPRRTGRTARTERARKFMAMGVQ